MTPFDVDAAAHPFAALLAVCTLAVILLSPLLAAFAVWRFLRLVSRIARALERCASILIREETANMLDARDAERSKGRRISLSAFGR